MRNLEKNCGMTVHTTKETLGPQIKEYQVKDKKVKTKHPPTDYYGRSYVAVTHLPFSLFLWYQKQKETDPDVVCVDVTIDGKCSRGWTLRSGRQHGIVIDSVQSKPLSFHSKEDRMQGTIQATFWRGQPNSCSNG
jgi:hypothetical protein